MRKRYGHHQAASAWLCLLAMAFEPPVSAAPSYLTIEAVPTVGGGPTTPWIIYLDGELERGAARRLADLLAQQRIVAASVYFNSPGGSLLEAMAIGRLLRLYQFDTRVGARTGDPLTPARGTCYSACPLAYAGGRRRYLATGSVLGVHRASNRVPVPDESAFAERVAADVTEYLASMGINAGLYDLMAQVPGGTIKALGYEEAVRLNLVNAGLAGEARNPSPAPAGMAD